MAESKIESNKVLLWTNPNTGSNFGAQTVAISNVSKYSSFEIVIKEYLTANRFCSQFINNDGNTYNLSWGSDTLQYRYVTSTSEGIHFNDGYYVGSYGDEAVGNGRNIPYKIYGIK